MVKSVIAFALVILTLQGIIADNPNISNNTCPPNEIYSSCGIDPCEDTCSGPRISLVCKGTCSPGCMCKPGYLRNTKRVCVLPKECDVCKPNEIFDMCGDRGCSNTCHEPDRKAKCTPGECDPGCMCLDGYLRNHNGSCVKPEDCRKCAQDNEIFVDCGNGCEITCGNKDSKPVKCAPCRPEGGCICKPGYVRGWNNECILPSECPTCSGENEFYSCGLACDRECATLGEPCQIFNIKCVERCYCKEGYARNSEGKCIPIDQCPPKQCKDDPNAIVVPCGDPCPTTCENMNYPVPVACTERCISFGCKCKDGYVLDKKYGKCILRENCPPVAPPPLQCGENEYLEKCPQNCLPKTCKNYLSGVKLRCEPTKDCIPACKCISQYFRNDEGLCVLWSECCPDPNAQVVESMSHCPGGTCAMPAIQKCKAPKRIGCQCKPGYLKVSDTNSTCIHKSECLRKRYK